MTLRGPVLRTVIMTVATTAFLMALVLLFAGYVKAATSVDVTGYAWSSNIGWISMSCQDGGPGQSNICSSSNYGVTVNSDGTLTGYAWSSNIGWIRFGGITGCPSGGNCNARLNGDASQLQGWARALSHGGGWDGWISLNCSNHGGCGSSNYRVRVNNTSNSYAWGGDVVGWTDFSRVSMPLAPKVTLTADPTAIPYDTSSDLNWTVEGLVDSWTASGAWSGPRSTSGGTENTGNLTADSLYKLECTGPAGTVSASAFVEVVEPPTADLEVCRWDGSAASDCVTAPEFLLIAGPSGSYPGDDIRIGWSGGDEASTTCQAIAGKDFDTGGARSGSDIITTLTTVDHPETYTVECSHPVFPTPASASVDVHIGSKCEPVAGVEAQQLVRSGSNFSLSWQKPVDIASCSVTGGGISISAGPNDPDPSNGCRVVDEVTSLQNKTRYTMTCNYPPDKPTISVDVIPKVEEI